MLAAQSFAKSLSHTAWRGVVGRTVRRVNAFGNALGDSLAGAMQSGYNTPAGGGAYDYRNGMDVDSDNAMAQREAMYGLGGMGARLGESRASLSQVWGQMTNDSIERGARAWGNWERASQTRWSALDAQAEAAWQRGAPARNARADAYARELALADIANESQRMANRAFTGAMERFQSQTRTVGYLNNLLGMSAPYSEADCYFPAKSATPVGGPVMTAWDGVTRVSAAENYLRRSTGGLDPLRANQMQFQVAQSLPDALALEVGGLAIARGLNILGRAATPIQGFVMGERSVLTSQLNAEMRAGLQADLAASRTLAPIDGIFGPAPVGVPVIRSKNPLSPVLEFDAHGNEILYRTMSESHFEYLQQTGVLLGTTETSISPSLAYSSLKYNGVPVRFTTEPGTSELLQEIGLAANKPARLQFPEMEVRGGRWMQTNARFKAEGGQMTTQLGQGQALEIFNARIVKFGRVQ